MGCPFGATDDAAGETGGCANFKNALTSLTVISAPSLKPSSPLFDLTQFRLPTCQPQPRIFDYGLFRDNLVFVGRNELIIFDRTV